MEAIVSLKLCIGSNVPLFESLCVNTVKTLQFININFVICSLISSTDILLS